MEIGVAPAPKVGLGAKRDRPRPAGCQDHRGGGLAASRESSVPPYLLVSRGILRRRKGRSVGGGQENSSALVAPGTPSSPESYLLPSQKPSLRGAHKAGI